MSVREIAMFLVNDRQKPHIVDFADPTIAGYLMIPKTVPLESEVISFYNKLLDRETYFFLKNNLIGTPVNSKFFRSWFSR